LRERGEPLPFRSGRQRTGALIPKKKGIDGETSGPFQSPGEGSFAGGTPCTCHEGGYQDRLVWMEGFYHRGGKGRSQGEGVSRGMLRKGVCTGKGGQSEKGEWEDALSEEKGGKKLAESVGIQGLLLYAVRQGENSTQPDRSTSETEEKVKNCRFRKSHRGKGRHP